MIAPKIDVGLQVGTQPPLGTVRAFVLLARLMKLDSVMVIDHFQNIFPTAIWDEDFSWLAAQRLTPHEHFDYQVFLGYLASRAGKLRLGVGVTEPIRRPPVLIAQAMLTLSHMTKRAPILGIGSRGTPERGSLRAGLLSPGGQAGGGAEDRPLVPHLAGTHRLRGQVLHARWGAHGPRSPEGQDPRDLGRRARPEDARAYRRIRGRMVPDHVGLTTGVCLQARSHPSYRSRSGAGPGGDHPGPAPFRGGCPHGRGGTGYAPDQGDARLRPVRPGRALARVWIGSPLRGAFPRLRGLRPWTLRQEDDRGGHGDGTARVGGEGAANVGNARAAGRPTRGVGEAGLRHVVLAPVSGLVSRKAAIYGIRATRKVARLLAGER